jgi:hypothetical protein
LSRFALEVPIFVKVPRAGRLIEAQTTNLSAAGAFFYIGMRLVEGTEVEFTLVVPSELTHTAALPVTCKGRVVRVQQDRPIDRIGIAVTIYSFSFVAAAGASVD